MNHLLSVIACLAVSIFLAGKGYATDYYVSPSGLDTNPGSDALPWKTVQKAADTLAPGDTAYVHAGVYGKVTVNVSGSSGGGYVTFTNYPGETPIIDATGVTVPSDDTALFLLTDKSYVTIQGFELRNYKTTNVAVVPAGIFLRGACQHIQINDCNIHDIWNTGGNVANSGNAFGIAVYGSSATSATDIVIDGNEIHDLKTGSSESLAINGNVTNAQVTNNVVHDCNNIGIVFIGFEGTGPTTALDQARDGICSDNLVYNISSQGNQAYNDGDYSADGLYCDGATRITMERNIVHDVDVGIELASEHSGKLTSAIIARDNFVYGSRQTGLALGGYAQSGTGGTDGCTITNNTFYNNDTLLWDDGEVQLRFRTSNCVLRDNIFYTGTGNWLITIPVSAANNVNNTFDYNLYYATAGAASAQWSWNNAQKTGFTAWKTASGQDSHSIFADPKFVSTASPDLHLQDTSPAVDSGDPAFAVGSGEQDIDAGSRITGSHVDIGADELGSSSPNVVITDGPPSPSIPINTSFNFTYTASGTPAAVFSLQSGGFPTGLSLSSNGVLSGTPTETGSFSGTVFVSNGVGTSDTQNFTMTVLNPVQTVSQTIAAFKSIPTKTYGQTAFKITPPKASSGLAVVVTVKSGPATILGNTITLTGAGTVTLAANQAGNSNYSPAPEVTTSFLVNKKAQTIANFETIPTQNSMEGSFFITPPAASSGLPVTVSVQSGPATISGNTVTITGVGKVVLAGDQAGDASYAAAKTKTTTFSVTANARVKQTIALPAISEQTTASPPITINATASSGLSVNLTVSGPATLSGNILTLTGNTGTVTLTASQPGNGIYAAASAKVTFKVKAP